MPRQQKLDPVHVVDDGQSAALREPTMPGVRTSYSIASMPGSTAYPVKSV
jgi:hypothetical protein